MVHSVPKVLRYRTFSSPFSVYFFVTWIIISKLGVSRDLTVLVYDVGSINTVVRLGLRQLLHTDVAPQPGRQRYVRVGKRRTRLMHRNALG